MGKRVFISQPMKGFTPIEIQELRKKCQDAYRAKFGKKAIVEFLGTQPKHFAKPPTNKEQIEMLSDSLKILASADVLVLIKPQGALPNGCFIECQVAKRYGIEVVTYRPAYESGWEEFG